VIVVAGVTNLQFSVPVDGFPVAYAPVRYPQGQTGVRVGGVGYNVAAALAALGSEVRLATFAGGDLLGGAVDGELRARGLHGPWVLAGPETPRSVILHEPGGERMICTDLRGLPQAVYPPAVFAEALRGAAYAVISNIGFARPLLAVARAAGVPVAADVQAIDDLDDDYNRDWMAAAQVLFCSHERLPVPPEVWVRMVRERYRTPVVVVGCGAGGALLGVRGTGEIRRVPAVAPRGVTSTAGAGDALAAAFMHVYLATGGDPDAAIMAAVLFAGYAVGAEPGGSDFLTGPELAALARTARRTGSSRHGNPPAPSSGGRLG
jgi:acarbose 7IV-phosphotransferase